MERMAKVLAVAALTVVSIAGATSPAMASGGSLVDIKIGDVVLHDTVDVGVAAALCGITTKVLSNDLSDDNEAACPLLSPAKVYKK
ncbi:hypothetical protein ACTMSW_29445 [Micromonospora sp. BQ11]|uniref:hypothetical protein n=1 Tax=Micromonospora sp. BQ11 TaxID=3452212 RepID=UPI003F8AB40F